MYQRVIVSAILVAAMAFVAIAHAQPQQTVRPGQTFRDCADCPEMVAIPSGSFMMGSPVSEAEREDDEGPQHRVTIQAFAAGRYEVTRAEFTAFVRATGYNQAGSCYVWENLKVELNAARTYANPGFSQSDRDPVVCVSWEDAQRYVGWLRQRTNRSYRLLSEAEWEYAARAGTTTARPWGERADDACAHANVADTTTRSIGTSRWIYHNCTDGYLRTSPVGSFKPNNFGLFDMIGNVWEWLEDCYNENYDGAPSDGRVWHSGDCARRVLRGGSWRIFPRFARAANRSGSGTVIRDINAGFRVARTF